MLPEITTMPLEFLRPLWLLGLIAILLFSLVRHKNSNKVNQQSIIATHLSANIVSKAPLSKSKQFAFSGLVAIACIALSGPTWRSIDMPVYEMEKAQVIVFDLSYSMFATDIKPNRLSQAKFKAIDLIKQWSEGEKALIAYAGDAFTVTPLTRDGNAIINHIPHLSPDIMPVRGSRADLALAKAIELLKNAGYAQGHIVFLSDGISAEQAKTMQEMLKGENWVVSILAVATKKGAPIRLSDGSLLKSNSGEIVVPKLSARPFYDITQASNGLYLTSRNDGADISQLGQFYDNKQSRKSESEAASDQFSIDDGYWLSFLLIPLFLLLFRKGLFFAVLLAVYLPLTSPPLEAAENTEQRAVDSSIWKNSQQNAFNAYQEGQYQAASELYKTPLEQGSALYKNKQYEQSLQKFTEATQLQPDNANAFYNQGNNFAQLQQLDKAIEAYDKALAIDPNLKIANENKGIIEQLKKQQEQQSENKNSQDSEQQQQDSQQDKKEQQSEQQQQDSQQDKKDQQSEQQQQDSQQDKKDQQSEQQQQDAQQDKKEQQSEQQQQDAQQDKKEQQSEQQQQEASQQEKEQQKMNKQINSNS